MQECVECWARRAEKWVRRAGHQERRCALWWWHWKPRHRIQGPGQPDTAGSDDRIVTNDGECVTSSWVLSHNIISDEGQHDIDLWILYMCNSVQITSWSRWQELFYSNYQTCPRTRVLQGPIKLRSVGFSSVCVVLYIIRMRADVYIHSDNLHCCVYPIVLSARDPSPKFWEKSKMRRSGVHHILPALGRQTLQTLDAR